MAPEYAMDGLFSIKSDVFSFGVLVLEIVSGKKNRGFYFASNQLNLLGHVSTNVYLNIIMHCCISNQTRMFFRHGSYGMKETL